MKKTRYTLGKHCSADGCRSLALVLSDPPSCPGHIADLEAWILRVEHEPDKHLSALARESYVIAAEEFGPISSRFYHKAAGEPPPNIKYRLSDIVVFCVLAATSGVIGNIAYDALKILAKRLMGAKTDRCIDERITFEFYEHVRTEIHGAERPNGDIPRNVEHEIELKHRLIIESKEK